MVDIQKKSYFNLLIFTILCGIFSLVLIMILLVINKIRDFIPFLITLEIGIFLIIIWCVIVIISNTNLINSAIQNNKVNIAFDSCPDFYSRMNDGTQDVCYNQTMYFDNNNKQYIMKIYPENETLPSINNPMSDTNANNKNERFPLFQIANSSALSTYNDKCGVLLYEPTDVGLANFKGYSTVPWTTIKARCSF